MGFWSTVSNFAESASRALPPCHICGAPGAQVCAECRRVACHRHAYSNVSTVRSVCSTCIATHFAWAEEDLQADHDLPEDWPFNEAPWQILGIKPDASAEDIRKAQRELSRELHPDKEQGDNVRQTAVNRAAQEMLKMRQAA